MPLIRGTAAIPLCLYHEKVSSPVHLLSGGCYYCNNNNQTKKINNKEDINAHDFIFWFTKLHLAATSLLSGGLFFPLRPCVPLWINLSQKRNISLNLTKLLVCFKCIIVLNTLAEHLYAQIYFVVINTHINNILFLTHT